MAPLTLYQVKEIALKAEADERTVQRYIDGEPVREMSRRRIARAMAQLGIPEQSREFLPASSYLHRGSSRSPGSAARVPPPSTRKADPGHSARTRKGKS